jgi:hypothetical protein
MSDTTGQCHISIHVRSCPNTRRKLRGAQSVETGHSTKSLCDSGEVQLGLSIIPRGEMVGSGGSALS